VHNAREYHLHFVLYFHCFFLPILCCLCLLQESNIAACCLILCIPEQPPAMILLPRFNKACKHHSDSSAEYPCVFSFKILHSGAAFGQGSPLVYVDSSAECLCVLLFNTLRSEATFGQDQSSCGYISAYMFSQQPCFPKMPLSKANLTYVHCTMLSYVLDDFSPFQ